MASPGKMHSRYLQSSGSPEIFSHCLKRAARPQSSFSINKQQLNKSCYDLPVRPQIISTAFSKDLNFNDCLDFTQACEVYFTGNHEQAKFLFLKICTRCPFAVEALLNAAVCEVHLKNYRKALEILEKAAKIDSCNEFISFNKAFIFAVQGFHEKCLEEINFMKKFSDTLSQKVSKLRTFSIINCGKLTPLVKNSEKSYRPTSRNEIFNSKVVLLQKPCRSRKSSHFSSKDRFDFVTLMPNREKIAVVNDSYRNKAKSESPEKVLQSFNNLSSPEKSSRGKKGKKFKKFSSISKIHSKISEFRLQKKESKFDLLEFSKESNKNYNKFKENEVKTTNEKEGLYQKNLSNQSSRKLLESKKNEKEREEKFQGIKRQVTEYFDYQLNNSEYSKCTFDSQSITEQELKFLIKQFELPVVRRDFERIDQVMLKLDFFKKYQKEIRMPLYEFSEIKFFLPNSTVFSQGDLGDNLYVIIKGSVTVIKSTEDFRNHPVVVNSLYSGQHFGDIALIHALKSNPFSNRSATIKTSESCHFLVIPKFKYQDLLLNLQLTFLQEKTIFLSNLKFFTGIDPALLIPLACNLHSKTFTLGEVIFSKGQVPEGIFILYKGQAKLVTQGFTSQKRFAGPFSAARANKKNYPQFVCNNYAGVRQKVKSCGFIEELYLQESENLREKYEKRKKDRVSHDQVLVKDEILFCQLFPGDYCAGRSILYENVAPSVFSLIANSPITEVLVLTRGHLFYLAEKFQQDMKIVLKNSYEADCPKDVDPQFMDEFFSKWQGFRREIIENIQQVNYIERHKP
jgi:CRP-like cAMP-binding protein